MVHAFRPPPSREAVLRRLSAAGSLWIIFCALRLSAFALESEAAPRQEPLAAAIAAVLASGQQPLLHWPDFSDRQDIVRQVYESVNFSPLWLRNGKPTQQAMEVLRTLSEADRRGLSPQDYDTMGLRDAAARIASTTAPTTADAAAFDSAMTVAVLRYVSDAHLGRVPPSAVGLSLEELEPRPFDPVVFVSELRATDTPAQLLATLDPQFGLFGPLTTALAHWRELAARSDFPAVPELPKLRPGESHDGVPALRHFLRAIGDLPNDVEVSKNPRLYDPVLVKAVKHFQEQHGLGADGVIGASTLNQLRVSPARRVRQIELALERLRWLPPPEDEVFIIVNLPEFAVRGYYRGSSMPALQLRAVVGSAALRHESPVLHATMQYLVFRPYWDVPPSIAKKEILPDLERDAGYFSKHHYEFHKGRIRQLPGNDNALGLLKFVFPNRFQVYMHDTPTKRLFAKGRRDFSHGCIRVSDAAALAEFVLRGQSKWNRETIETAMNSGADNRRVYLERPVGVYLLYSTVIVDEDGTIRFLEDIYGHDARLDSALAKGPPYPYPVRTPSPSPTPSETATPSE